MMTTRTSTLNWLYQETVALLSRLDRVKPFALQETMVPAAAPSHDAQAAIERYLVAGRRELRRLVDGYLRWLHSPAGQAASLSEAQRRFTFLRMRFNTVLSQFDIFSDVMTQRSENETGVWLGGLDALATDGLRLPGHFYDLPPIICHVDRGHGAAIRRARTRLPGGGESPLAIVRVPRERMISNGIASSLLHEVGHQSSALLNLIPSLQEPLRLLQQNRDGSGRTWLLFERWLSEILADLWSVAKVGVTSTLGLMAVVSLPRAFVFRVALDDPHPIPWIRVKLSCAMGQALYPHPQWDRVARMWEAAYPLTGLDLAHRRLFAELEATIPSFVSLVLEHRPTSLRGQSIGKVLAMTDRRPEQLRIYFTQWQGQVRRMRRAPPTLVFATIGQARADGQITPQTESRLLAWLLTYWALQRTLSIPTEYVAQLTELSR